MLSAQLSGMPQADIVLRSGWFSPYTLTVSMWSLVSYKVSAVNDAIFVFVLFERFVARTIFSCFQTTDEEGVPSKLLVKKKTFKCLVRRFELSFTIHPQYCASQFLRNVFYRWRSYKKLQNAPHVKFQNVWIVGSFFFLFFPNETKELSPVCQS